ncbi:hypothetical protein E9549_05475 [Blastococcus sp. MG754426]|uniref:hypothetical protein n=1 Tax=unclassified Blastococcus TaxID=2619396 RepID=UPI001EEF955A|nr:MULTISPECIES: hypothetical protein [unclassified Blastococcus]MCF6506857.1 hypothetical protein [Blastococcus sp. MG754426]MCF6511657.1 hypothetical protein [Blastococcus sp. MG754427]
MLGSEGGQQVVRQPWPQHPLQLVRRVAAQQLRATSAYHPDQQGVVGEGVQPGAGVVGREGLPGGIAMAADGVPEPTALARPWRLVHQRDHSPIGQSRDHQVAQPSRGLLGLQGRYQRLGHPAQQLLAIVRRGECHGFLDAGISRQGDLRWDP